MPTLHVTNLSPDTAKLLEHLPEVHMVHPPQALCKPVEAPAELTSCDHHLYSSLFAKRSAGPGVRKSAVARLSTTTQYSLVTCLLTRHGMHACEPAKQRPPIPACLPAGTQSPSHMGTGTCPNAARSAGQGMPPPSPCVPQGNKTPEHKCPNVSKRRGLGPAAQQGPCQAGRCPA